MTTLQDLQAKQAKELELFTKQQEIAALLPDIKFSLSIGWKTAYNLRFDLKGSTPEQANEVLQAVVKALPPTGEVHPIYDCVYYFNFRNPCRYEYSIDFCYLHSGISVDFDFALNVLDKEILTIGSRKITDCEYHYFTGETIKQMMARDFRTYQLNDGILKQPVIKYFGGSKSYKTNFAEDYNTIVSIIGKTA